MSLLEIKNLSLSFGDKIIFKNTDFVLFGGDKIGVVGLNGAGKSTFMKILNGTVLPDKGDIVLNAKTKFGYLEQDAEINNEHSIMDFLRGAFKELFDIERKMEEVNTKMATASEKELEKLFDQSSRYFDLLEQNDFYAIDSKIEKVASGLGITEFGLDRQIKSLSGGQRAKVILAKLLLEKPDVLLLDEPTNFLDAQHIEWLKKYLTSFEGSFIVVSHNPQFLSAITNVIYDIDNYKFTRYNLSFDKFLAQKELQKEQYEKQYSMQQKTIEKLETYIAKNIARASTTKMAQSRQKQLDKMVKLDKPTEALKPNFLFGYKQLGSKVLLRVSNLVIGYDKPLMKPIHITLEKGEKLAVTGFNGIGKSTFLKTIAGIIPSLSGEFTFATNVKIGYYEQENIFSNAKLTPLEFVREEFPKLTDKELRGALSRCALKSEHINESLSRLSGGEQSKVKLCILSLNKNNVLILDEPTNHLDKLAIEQLMIAIKKFEGTVLFVSHDKDFVNKVADKILNLEELTVK